MPHPSRKRSGLIAIWRSLPVSSGRLAMFLLALAVLLSGLESAYVQVVTTQQLLGPALLIDRAFLLLLSLDLLVPTAVALLSRRFFMLYLLGQCLMSIMLLHYNIFFYNPLTLATIYHSLQGAASLGIDIFGFAKPEVILRLSAIMVLKILLVQLSMTDHERMPRLWRLRGLIAVGCLAMVCVVYSGIYGHTGLSSIWVDLVGHRTATERRMEAGTRDAVRNIGYIATWMGELATGKYKDTELIYAQTRCADPEKAAEAASCPRETWLGLPFPPAGAGIVLMQVESLDYAALGLKVNGHKVLPFMDKFAEQSLLLKVFAPHKVGSSNSDYEILNARLADQNVIYYGYIKEYPDSVIHILADKGYNPAIIHGLPGRLFNLRDAYTAQGFKELYFKEELMEAGYAPSRLIMEHIKDEALFAFAADYIGKTKKESPENPWAQFLITMSSHVPFMDVLPRFHSDSRAFSRYVSSMHYFDGHFAAYYEHLPKGTLIIMWGDHGSDVEYPEGYAPNSRHVPFMVHVKGQSEWLGGQSGARPGEYTLCRLSYYLRRILDQANPAAFRD